MLIYLDTAIAIYAIEGQAAFMARAKSRLATAYAGGDDLATSNLARAECLVKPVRDGDPLLEADYLAFLRQTLVMEHPAEVFDLMASIRAASNITVPDALHLATAIHHKCDSFLTNDHRLAGFAGISVEALP